MPLSSEYKLRDFLFVAAVVVGFVCSQRSLCSPNRLSQSPGCAVVQSISALKVRAQRNAAGDMEAARGYRHTGLDKRGSDVNGARKLAGLNANQADGAMATNDAVRRYFISTNVSS
jgi:hypothetical protein